MEAIERQVFFDTFGQHRDPTLEALLYIHIPYCHDLCRFCPFHVRVDKGDEIYARYTDTLCREMAMLGERPYVQGMAFQAVYFGGGSPSILDTGNLTRIFDAMYRYFNIRTDAEISFEGEPRTLSDPYRLDLLREKGVSRISFGLQTYDEVMRQHFNIVANLDDVRRVIHHGRERCFDEINVDMMYDLPGQTVTTLEEDLKRLVNDGVDSVDYYNLHYYAFPQKFKAAMENGQIPPKPSEDMHFALAEQIRYRLGQNGYRDVADQVFSRKPKVCEYFRLLWGGGDGDHRAETLAMGSSARGYLVGHSYMNFGNVHRYQDAVATGELPVEKVSGRLRNPANRGAVFMPKFFCLNKVFETARATIDPSIWERWHAAGLIYETEDTWCLSERGKLWTTNMMFDALEDEQRDFAQGTVGGLARKPGIRTGTF
jgi:coproporphyrinogen III oxidase-like Fe-S oxidoreductase